MSEVKVEKHKEKIGYKQNHMCKRQNGAVIIVKMRNWVTVIKS